MKKLLLATAVSVAAGSASAATIYDADGLTYKVKGDWQIQMRQDAGKDQHEEIEFDDLEIKNSIVYDLGDGMKAFGQLDFGFKDAADGKSDSSNLEEAYLGMAFGKTKVSIGKQNLGADEFGIEMAYETIEAEDAFDDASAEDGDDVVKVEFANEMFTAIGAYQFDAEGEDSEGDEVFDVFVSGSFGGLTLAADVQSRESVAGDEVDLWGVSAAYDLGMFTIAADYSIADDKAADIETDVTNLAASFKATDTIKIAAGTAIYEEEGSDDITEWYANVTYKFAAQKNVSLFAELSDSDEDDVDMGYLAGIRLKF